LIAVTIPNSPKQAGTLLTLRAGQPESGYALLFAHFAQN